MFGLSFLTLPILLTVIGIALSAGRFIYTTFFSRSAKAEKVLLWLERQKAAYEMERERYQVTRDRIKKEPPKTGEDLRKSLEDKWNKP